ncbi:histidine kinase dimerization/phospho-acceptor domain-containing protein [Streptomyces sp. NRRL S-1813]|uniref:histidine kinase dimerization/phospho-acceptor domain-containing protein n=1 Tax=Streptomyces sp. NRRL S-1813 TaxID=1463888 RepID=UPI003B63E7A2
MAAALERDHGELRRLEAGARRFAADVSHELRTPLGAMSAVTEVLDEDAVSGRLDAETAEAVQLISDKTRKLTRVVADLMEVSRFDAGASALHLDEVDVMFLPALLLAGCGISPTAPTTAGAPASGALQPGTRTHDARLLFVGPTGLRYAARTFTSSIGPQEAIDLLLKGPSPAERKRGLTTLVPAMKVRVTAEAGRNGVVHLRLPTTVDRLDHAAVSQLVCTAAKARDRDQTKVLVRVHESQTGRQIDSQTDGTWDVRCDSVGNAYPAAAKRP